MFEQTIYHHQHTQEFPFTQDQSQSKKEQIHAKLALIYPHLSILSHPTMFQDIIPSALFRSGDQLTPAWADSLFNFGPEKHKSIQIASSYQNAESAVKLNLKRQIKTIVTEFGHEQVLAFQPPYEFLLKPQIEEGEQSFYVEEIVEYGERAEGFNLYKDLGEAPNRALFQAYELLAHSKKDQAVIVYSPTEYYQKLNSPGDVINIFRIKELLPDGSKIIEAKYIFLNKLTNQQRAWLLSFHNPNNKIPQQPNNQDILLNPQLFTPNNLANDPITEHIQHLESEFTSVWKTPLLLGIKDPRQYQIDQLLTDLYLDYLYTELKLNNRYGFAQKLNELLVLTHLSYAITQGLNIQQYFEMIRSREIELMGEQGSSPTDSPFADPLSSEVEWKKETKECKKCHHNFSGDKCPICGEKQE